MSTYTSLKRLLCTICMIRSMPTLDAMDGSHSLFRSLLQRANSGYNDACRAPLDRCRAPGGGRLELPFVCPMDHIFQPAHFADEPALHGPPLFVREHSFLENQAVPRSVFVSVLA